MSGLRQGVTVSLLTLCSRVLGFIREAVAAQLFGASAATDTFFAVFRLPNLLRQVLAEGGFTVALVPILHAARRQDGPSGFQDVAVRTLALLLIVLLPMTLLGLLLAPQIAHWLLPALPDAQALQLATRMLWWTLPYILVAGLIGWSAAILHAHDRFAVPAVTPLLLSVCMIMLPLLCASHLSEPVLALAIAVLLGGVLQLAWQGGALWRLGMPLWPHPKSRGSELRRIARILLPALLAASTLQLILLIDSSFAARLPTGSVTWLYLADRIVQFPQGIIGTAVSVVLVQRLATTDPLQPGPAVQTLDQALRLVLLLSTLGAVCGWSCARPIASALYGYGQFTTTDVEMTAQAIRLMAMAMPAVLLVRALGAACLAHGGVRLLLTMSMLAVLVDLAGNLALTGLPVTATAPHVRIAATSAVAVWVYALGLLAGIWRRRIWWPQPGTPVFTGRVVLTGLTCAALLDWWVDSVAPAVAAGAGWRLLQLAGVLGAGVSAYAAIAALSGLRVRHLR